MVRRLIGGIVVIGVAGLAGACTNGPSPSLTAPSAVPGGASGLSGRSVQGHVVATAEDPCATERIYRRPLDVWYGTFTIKDANDQTVSTVSFAHLDKDISDGLRYRLQNVIAGVDQRVKGADLDPWVIPTQSNIEWVLDDTPGINAQTGLLGDFTAAGAAAGGGVLAATPPSDTGAVSDLLDSVTITEAPEGCGGNIEVDYQFFADITFHEQNATWTFVCDGGVRSCTKEFAPRAMSAYGGTVSRYQDGNPTPSTTTLVELTDRITAGLAFRITNDANVTECDGSCAALGFWADADLSSWVNAGQTNIDWTLAPGDGLPAASNFSAAVAGLVTGATSVTDPGFQYLAKKTYLMATQVTTHYPDGTVIIGDPDDGGGFGGGVVVTGHYYAAVSFYERHVSAVFEQVACDEHPAAPAWAAAILSGNNYKPKGRQSPAANYVSQVARLMGPGGTFAGVAKTDHPAYELAVWNYLKGLGLSLPKGPAAVPHPGGCSL